MTKLYSSGAHSPVVPVIGPNVLDLTEFQCGPLRREQYSEERGCDASPEAMDYLAALFVLMAVAFGPTIAWLLIR